jgi:hypothetical protein
MSLFFAIGIFQVFCLFCSKTLRAITVYDISSLWRDIWAPSVRCVYLIYKVNFFFPKRQPQLLLYTCQCCSKGETYEGQSVKKISQCHYASWVYSPTNHVLFQNFGVRSEQHVISSYATPTVDAAVGVAAPVWDLNVCAGEPKSCDLQPYVARLCLHTTERYTTTAAYLMSTEKVIRRE